MITKWHFGRIDTDLKQANFNEINFLFHVKEGNKILKILENKVCNNHKVLLNRFDKNRDGEDFDFLLKLNSLSNN